MLIELGRTIDITKVLVAFSNRREVVYIPSEAGDVLTKQIASLRLVAHSVCKVKALEEVGLCPAAVELTRENHVLLYGPLVIGLKAFALGQPRRRLKRQQSPEHVSSMGVHRFVRDYRSNDLHRTVTIGLAFLEFT